MLVVKNHRKTLTKSFLLYNSFWWLDFKILSFDLNLLFNWNIIWPHWNPIKVRPFTPKLCNWVIERYLLDLDLDLTIYLTFSTQQHTSLYWQNIETTTQITQKWMLYTIRIIISRNRATRHASLIIVLISALLRSYNVLSPVPHSASIYTFLITRTIIWTKSEEWKQVQ